MIILRTSKKIVSSKKQIIFSFLTLMLFLSATIGSVSFAQTPVAANGQLSVSGTNLVNENGTPIQLRGMSTHGLQWFASCINYQAISTLASDWGMDVLRLAMYIDEDESGWVYNPDYYNSLIDELVDITEQFGVYCIIDWHVHNPGNPNASLDDARVFWEYMSSKHANKEHVLYEICNEPNGVDWPTVKSYAEEIIPIIRANDPDQIIIVGTPTWSQDVDVASYDPLDYDNIMYTLHFYSGTHGQYLRDKGNTAISNGLALFVTEWGTSQASGDNGPYLAEADLWMSWMQDNQISWCNWSYCDKAEASAALVNGSCLNNDWNNTTPSGAYVKENMLNPADSWSGSGNIPPTGFITSPIKNAKFEVGETITIEATASDRDGSVVSVEFFANGSSIGSDDSAPYSIDYTANSPGIIDLNLQITDNDGATNTSSIVTIEILTEIIQTAYPDGTPHPIPGEINATYFDVGGEGIAYHDVDEVNKGGYNRFDEGVDTENSEGGNIGYVINDEWVEYTVDVAASGTYAMELRVASEPGGGQFHLEFDGTDVTGTVDVPQTGSWTSYQTLRVENITLTAGEQVMRIYIETGDFNFAAFSFEYIGGTGNIPPTAVISANPTAGDVPLTVSFDGSGSSDSDGSIQSYNWDLGDGTTASGAIISHTYYNPGTFDVVLTVTDNEGETDQATVTISATEEGVNNAPIAVVSATPTSGTAPLTVNFNASGSSDPDGDALTYTWSFGDGSTGSGATVSHTYNTAGSYTASVTVSDGELTDEASVNITVNAGGVGGCDSYTSISLPFAYNGAGEFCWFTNGDIVSFNSWNLDLLEINGVDLTNKYGNQYSGNIPARIDGKYYIRYESSVDWGHFEISGSGGTEGIIEIPTTQNTLNADDNAITLYPNPFSETITIDIPNPDAVESIVIVDQTGRTVSIIGKAEIQASMNIGGDLARGIYVVKINAGYNSQQFVISKQ